MQETLNKEHIPAEIQARILESYERKTRLMRWTAFGILILLLISIWIVLYLLSKPLPATEITLKHIQEQEKILATQRAQIDSDRADVRVAREENIRILQQLINHQIIELKRDSIRKMEKDSFYYLP